MAQRLTDKTVRALPAPARGNKITYDTEIKGFGCRVTAAGSRAFILNYRRRKDGRECRYTIGSFPDWSVAAAREKAKELKRHIDGGGDPVGEHVADRAAPTVANLCARFLEEHVAKQRPHTQEDYRSIVVNDILPALGKMKVAAIEFEHVERLHTKITKRAAPVRANRVVAVLTTMFGLAIRWKMRADNPAKGVKRNQEHGRQRYLKPDELVRLTAALAKDPNQQDADIIRLLLLTGARRSEALAATWNQLDLDAGEWIKPHSVTKQKRVHRLPLNAPARQLLARLQESSTGSPWVFPGRNGADPRRRDLKHAWKRICAAAGITGLRVHDLRHSHASHLVSAGFSLPVIGALLGHSNPATTARYSHLLDDPLRKASEAVGAIISGKPAADIVPIRRGRRR